MRPSPPPPRNYSPKTPSSLNLLALVDRALLLDASAFSASLAATVAPSGEPAPQAFLTPLAPTPWLALVRGLAASPPAAPLLRRFPPAIGPPPLARARRSRAAASSTRREALTTSAAIRAVRRAASASTLPTAPAALPAPARNLPAARVNALPLATQCAPRSFSPFHSNGNSPSTGIWISPPPHQPHEPASDPLPLTNLCSGKPLGICPSRLALTATAAVATVGNPATPNVAVLWRRSRNRCHSCQTSRNTLQAILRFPQTREKVQIVMPDSPSLKMQPSPTPG